MKTLVILSGGLDSVALAHYYKQHGDVKLLSFDYGQRHKKELNYASACAARLDAQHITLDISGMGALLSSALTSSVKLPTGHYSQENLKQTIVPNRNMIFLSIAAGVAVSSGISRIAIGAHANDYAVYPDCRPEFLGQFERTVRLATGDDVQILYPFVHYKKSQIVKVGAELGVPFEKTWSCYKGGAIHCGICSTCVDRRRAFAEASVDDPTEYKCIP